MNLLKKYFQDNKPLVFLALLSGMLLYLYWLNAPKIWWDFYDSIDYIDYARALYTSWGNLVNDYRAPLYPVLLHFVGFDQQNNLSNNLVLVQSILFISIVVVVWEILKKITLSTKTRVLVALMIVLGLDIFWMVKTPLTEILTMFFLVLTTLTFLNLQERFSYLKVVLFSLSFLGLVFTRPFNLYLFVPLLLFWIVRQVYSGKGKFSFQSASRAFRERKVRWLGLFVTLALILIPVGTYAAINQSRYHYFGVSIEGGLNLFSRLALHPKYLPSSDSNPKLLEFAKICTHGSGDYFNCQYPYIPQPSHNPGFATLTNPRDDSFNKQIDQFAMRVSLSHPYPYVLFAARDVATSLTELFLKSGSDWPGTQASGALGGLFVALAIYQVPLHWFFAVMVLGVAVPYFVYSYYKKSGRLDGRSLATLLVLYIIIVYYVGLTGLVASGDFGRMIIPALPLIYIFSLVVAFDIFRMIKTGLTPQPKRVHARR